MTKKDVMGFLKDCSIIVKEFEKDSTCDIETIGRMSHEILRLRNELKKIKESK